MNMNRAIYLQPTSSILSALLPGTTSCTPPQYEFSRTNPWLSYRTKIYKEQKKKKNTLNIKDNP